MINERLRRSMLRAGLGAETLADRAQVVGQDGGAVGRGDVVPYPRTRYRVAALLGEDESYLWPGAVDRASLAGAELVAAYGRRSDVPAGLWTELLAHAQRSVDVLAFAGLFLTEEQPSGRRCCGARADAGCGCGCCWVTRTGPAWPPATREHRIGGEVAGRVRAVLGSYRQLAEVVEMRLHDTPLYNSVYRFDDEMLVNIHAYGILAAYTPVMHLRRVDGAYFNTYMESFERVWASARALDPGDVAGMP